MRKVTIGSLAKEAGVHYMTVWNLKNKLGRMPTLSEVIHRPKAGRPAEVYMIKDEDKE